MKALHPAWIAAAFLGAALSGCYRGTAKPIEVSTILHDPDWLAITNVPTLKQDGEHECGATAAAMLLNYWGKPTTPEEIRTASKEPSDKGISAGFLRSYLRERGLQAYLIQGSLADLEHELKDGRPVLVGVQREFSTGMYAHYQLVVGINKNQHALAVIDPADGWREYSFTGFAQEWGPANSLTMVVTPAPASAREIQSAPIAIAAQ